MNGAGAPPPAGHATALVIGEKGIVILGASGAGKSALAERLIAEARARGLFARLVGDDRLRFRVEAGRLIAAPHPILAGRIERRGIGIVAVPALDEAVIGHVVLLEATPSRLPDPAAATRVIEGLPLPSITLRADADLAARTHLVLDWLAT